MLRIVFEEDADFGREITLIICLSSYPTGHILLSVPAFLEALRPSILWRKEGRAALLPSPKGQGLRAAI